jgi:hypothetical protein
MDIFKRRESDCLGVRRSPLKFAPNRSVNTQRYPAARFSEEAEFAAKLVYTRRCTAQPFAQSRSSCLAARPW